MECLHGLCIEGVDRIAKYQQLGILQPLTVKGGNPLSFAMEIIIEIKQFNSGRMASHASIESIWCTH